ncbi:cytochrome C oxidase subunit IV family protein [Achromobacter aloeverae]
MKIEIPESQILDDGLRRRRRRLLAIWALLLLLAALTVGTAYIPLGSFNMPLNILIAGVKAVLIGVFFMHLAAPQAVPRLVCALAGLMLVIMFALSGVDYYTRDDKGGQPPPVSYSPPA